MYLVVLLEKSCGTTYWCLDGNSSIICGVNIVPFGSDTLDPIRCELASIYIILQLVECMVDHYYLKTAVIEI